LPTIQRYNRAQVFQIDSHLRIDDGTQAWLWACDWNQVRFLSGSTGQFWPLLSRQSNRPCYSGKLSLRDRRRSQKLARWCSMANCKDTPSIQALTDLEKIITQGVRFYVFGEPFDVGWGSIISIKTKGTRLEEDTTRKMPFGRTVERLWKPPTGNFLAFLTNSRRRNSKPTI